MSPKFLERYKIQIRKIITANDEAISGVVLALHDVPLILRAVPFAAKTAAKTHKISEEDALDIIVVVGLLTALGEDNNLSKDKAIDLITEFVKNDEFFSDFSEDNTTQLRKRLVDLLDNASTLRVLYKASQVFNDYERIFFDAKVVTDIRPVFNLDTDTGIEVIQAFTITHAIKIEYKDLEGEKEFFVALDSTALEDLHEEIVDALEKTHSIKLMLKKAQMTYVDSDLEIDSEVKENPNQDMNTR
jgi:hypothetical protein